MHDHRFAVAAAEVAAARSDGESGARSAGKREENERKETEKNYSALERQARKPRLSIVQPLHQRERSLVASFSRRCFRTTTAGTASSCSSSSSSSSSGRKRSSGITSFQQA